MLKTIEGIYENGIIRPSETLKLENDSKVLITIFTYEHKKDSSLDLLSKEELFELAMQRSRKLKEAGIERSEVAEDILALLDEIRQDAMSKGVSLVDDLED
jgi:predicted DNA-binding antitoxin AbrB/MazE fold protein